MYTGLDALKSASKKVVHKAAEATGDIIDKNLRNVEEIIIPSEKRRKNIKQIKRSIIKMEHYKICKLLHNSTVLTFVTKNWIEVNDSSSGQYSVNKNIRFKTSVSRSDLFNYSDAYIVVK